VPHDSAGRHEVEVISASNEQIIDRIFVVAA
jgi:hypothetical protein